MWVARDKSGILLLFKFFPKRLINSSTWRRDNNTIVLESCLFPNIKWEDEPIEVVINEKPNISLSDIREETPDDTIVLTHYYEDYEKEHEWFVNMLKHQERYKDCTDEEVEKIWKNHIKEEYTFDEIWDTIQCEGYTKIALRMGRHDHQSDYDYVLETKEYIDEKMKNY